MAMLEHEGIQILDWLSYSPDLSPIENLWVILKLKVHAKHYTSKETQIEAVRDIWSNDDGIKNVCKSLIHGMPRRIHACIAARGEPLKYWYRPVEIIYLLLILIVSCCLDRLS